MHKMLNVFSSNYFIRTLLNKEKKLVSGRFSFGFVSKKKSLEKCVQNIDIYPPFFRKSHFKITLFSIKLNYINLETSSLFKFTHLDYFC